MTTATAPDGSAQAPRSTFDSTKERKIIAVISLANLDPGTKISYVRYIDDKFVNSKSSVLKKKAKFFYFEYTARSGKNFTKGHYRLRLYVNQKAAWETTYEVT